jgi:hypothetical protein
MPIVAKASKTVRNKNLILVLMCAGFAAWFAYDGFLGWPKGNDASVAAAAQNPKLVFKDEDLATLRSWPGHSNSTEIQRLEIAKILHDHTPDLTFRTDSEISLQQEIVYGLALATFAALLFFFNCQRRRAILDTDAKTLSPKPGLLLPIDAITKIDNTRWKKTGIVDITYTTPAGKLAETDLDDYKLDGLPPLLNELSTLAEKAEFIPPPARPLMPPNPKPPNPLESWPVPHAPQGCFSTASSCTTPPYPPTLPMRPTVLERCFLSAKPLYDRFRHACCFLIPVCCPRYQNSPCSWPSFNWPPAPPRQAVSRSLCASPSPP